LADVLNVIKSHMPTRRRLIQLYSALLYNAHAKGFISGNIYTGVGKYICVPGLNCYSCPGAVGSCPLGALQNAIASTHTTTPAYVLGILILFGLILGRTICGYICPFGLFQELLYKIPSPKIKKNRATRVLSYLKYIVLGVFVIGIPLWYSFKYLPVPAFCKFICPAGTLEGAVGLLSHPKNKMLLPLLGSLFTQKAIILVFTALCCVFIFRAFCRFICPLGAIYGLFSKVNFIGVKLERESCIDCGKCHAVCKMDIRQVGDHECIHCGECIDSCPTKAISFKAGSIVLRQSEHDNAENGESKSARYIWAIAVLILVLIFITVN